MHALKTHGSYIFLSLFLILLTFHKWYGPDIWYHMTWGRDVLERHSFLPINRSLLEQPIFANIYWIFQTSMYLLYSWGGTLAVSLFFTVLWCGTAFAWAKLARLDRVSGIFSPLFLFIFIVCMQMRFDQRPEGFSYFFLAVLIWALMKLDLSKRIPRKTLLGFLALEIVFTNTHGYFSLGPMLAGALAVAQLLRPETRSNFKQAMIVFATLFAGSFVSPFGVGAWEMVFGYAKVAEAMSGTNVEMFLTWKIDLTGAILCFWIYWIIMLFTSLYMLARRRNAFIAIIALAGCVLGFKLLRNLPLFLIFAGPLTGVLLESLDLRIGRFREKRGAEFSVQIIYSLIALVLCSEAASGAYHRDTMSLTSFGTGLEWAAYPIGVVEKLKSIGFKGNLFTDSYDGGYAEFQMPEIKVAGDSYFYDAATTLEFFDAIKKADVFRAVANRIHFDGLIINLEDTDILKSLWADPTWLIAYADTHRILFLRASEYPNQRVTLASQVFYHGDDLRHWIYAFSPVTWMQLALQTGDRALAEKLVLDVASARHIPSTFVRLALIFATANSDPSVARIALSYASRMYESTPGDLVAITKMAQ